jgi:hypothetical protein
VAGALLAAVFLPLALASSAAAAGADSGSVAYLAAVQQARAICTRAAPDDTAAASEAARVLRAGTGTTQSEVLNDLLAEPPDLTDAANRLAQIELALSNPLSTPDGPGADSKLRAILAEPRYRTEGVSPLDRFWAWVGQQLARLLAALLGRGGAGVTQAAELAVATGLGVAIAIFLARSLWSRRGGSVVVAMERRPRSPATDWFAEADRRASAGDYPAALRALTSAVATAIGGEGAWETSPFTVRELFMRSARIEPLRPLLLPFEASAYGHRQPDAEVYARAAGVAEAYRPGSPT